MWATLISFTATVVRWEDKKYPEVYLKFPASKDIQVTEHNIIANVKLM